MSDLTLILGGARSGKSTMAQRVAELQAARSNHPVLIIATGVVTDEEMCERIERHRQQRPVGWVTAEEQLAPARAVLALSAPHIVVLEDLGCLVTNHLLAEMGELCAEIGPDQAADELGLLLNAVRQGGHHLVVVSNEVGMGLVPQTPLGRLFRDRIGFANQWLAREASLVVLMVAGIPVVLRGRLELGGQGEGSWDEPR